MARDRIILDPGIGFGKTFDHNLILINRLKELAAAGYPVLVGASRKAFLGHILGGVPAGQRDGATAAVSLIAVYNGAHIVRVHDIGALKEMLAVVRAVDREHA